MTRPALPFVNPVLMPRVFVERGPALERNHDITRDGKHFLGVVEAGSATTAAAAPQIQVVLNRVEELKARVPTK